MIIGQDLSNDQDITALKADPGLVGHPIKLQHEWFDRYLDRGFTPIIRKVLTREQGRDRSS